jgi:hypothetical protein
VLIPGGMPAFRTLAERYPGYDSFGPKRLHLGSDLTRMPCSYVLCVRMFIEELRWHSGEDLEWIMDRSICERLGWAAAIASHPGTDLRQRPLMRSGSLHVTAIVH